MCTAAVRAWAHNCGGTYGCGLLALAGAHGAEHASLLQGGLDSCCLRDGVLSQPQLIHKDLPHARQGHHPAPMLCGPAAPLSASAGVTAAAVRVAQAGGNGAALPAFPMQQHPAHRGGAAALVVRRSAAGEVQALTERALYV